MTHTFIALFRGINVGGKNILPMRSLVTVLEELGAQNVRTYIQSGNAVFQSHQKNLPRWQARIRASIQKQHGFSPQILLLHQKDMKTAMEQNPFSDAVLQAKTLHLFFLESLPKAFDENTIKRLQKDTERFRLVGKVFYLHAPDGIGRSKLAANIEKILNVSATARNWRTVSQVMDIAEKL